MLVEKGILVSILCTVILHSSLAEYYVENNETITDIPEELLLIVTSSEYDNETVTNLNDTNQIEISSTENSTDLESENKTSKPFRLPLSFVPYNYKLNIIPVLDELPITLELENSTTNSSGFDYEKFKAPAKIWIRVTCKESAQNITLHASDIDINNSSIKVLKLSNGSYETIKGFQADNETDFFIIFLENFTEKGENYEIYIEFVSRIAGDRLNGLYMDYYFDKSTNEKRYIATTLFAPFHARKAFVCFDEPSFRATFDITVGRSEKYHTLSNAEINSTLPMSDVPGWYWDTFNTSPNMPTYIVAIIVSDLQFSQQTQHGFENSTTDIRVYAPNHLIEGGGANFGRNLTAAVLTKFENYFQMEYPLDKLYSVALPHFYFSAMENWGVITYKDPIIINMPNVTTQKEIFRIASVVSHEVGHQWFGNLVTVKWWAYVWLKEAFVSYYEFHALNTVLPYFKPWTQFTHESLQVALDFDAGPDTHPLDNEPKNAGAVADIYTRIPYDKGASILRMVASFLTEETFHKGINKYLEKMKYSSAEPNDVYEALQEAVDEDGTLSANASVKEIAETWTQQSGFPLLRVKIAGKNELIITQEKFNGENFTLASLNASLSTANGTESNKVDSWWIPVTMIPSSKDTNFANLSNSLNYPSLWIGKDEKNVTIEMDTNQLILLNPGAVGYYRVLYDDILFQRIIVQLVSNRKELLPEARSQLLDDYFKLTFAEYQTIDSLFLLLGALQNEEDYSVWATFFDNMDKPFKLLSTSNYFKYFQIYLQEKIGSVLDFDKLKTSSDLELMLQSRLFKWACKLKQKHCIDYSISMMEMWQAQPEINPIVADIQRSVYCTAVKTLSGKGNETDDSLWNFISNQYDQEFFSVQKDRLLYALSCTENTELLLKLLKTTVNETIDMHDIERSKIVQNVADNPLGRILALDFIDENFKSLYKNVSSANPVTEYLKSLSTRLNTVEDLAKMEAFIKKHEIDLEKKKKTLDKYVEVVKKNINWVDRFGKLIHGKMVTKYGKLR